MGQSSSTSGDKENKLKQGNVTAKRLGGKRPPKNPHITHEQRLAKLLQETSISKQEQPRKPTRPSIESCSSIGSQNEEDSSSQQNGAATERNPHRKTTQSLVEAVNSVQQVHTMQGKPLRRLKPKAPSSTHTPPRSFEEDSFSSYGSGESAREPVGLRSFDVLKVLGKGSHGKVFLVRHKGNRQLYAMKQLKKRDVVRNKQVENTKRELRVHKTLLEQEIQCPYITKLRYAFHSKTRLYMVFDYCAGGELYYHIGQRGRLPESLAKIYAAEIALSLGYLHKLSIVYRDLKPENLVLDGDGHIHLVDFGLSIDGFSSRTSGCTTFCGTTEYLAPEILHFRSHGSCVDWWAFGMVLYEMLTGLPPWYSYNQEEIVEGIKTKPLELPSYLSQEAKSLLGQLLQKEPERRLGARHDLGEILRHPFFQSVNWRELAQKKTKAPFIPPNDGIACNFDREFTESRLDIEGDYSMPSSSDPFQGFYFDSEDPINCPTHATTATNPVIEYVRWPLTRGIHAE